MSTPGRTFALIPAGGRSVRMGRPKLLLPLGSGTVLGQVIGALRRAGLEHILVVVGPHAAALQPLAVRAGAETLLLAAETPDMRATVEHGLTWLGERFRPGAGDAWLLAPGDHPTLDPAVVRLLLEAGAGRPDASIVVPAFRGRRGHPVLIGWEHVVGIRAHPAGEGLNAYLRGRAAETLVVPVATDGILQDLDTPEDYQRLLASWGGQVLRWPLSAGAEHDEQAS